MQANINGKEIPYDTIQGLGIFLGGTVHVSGEAIDEDDRLHLTSILDPLKDNDVIQYRVMDSKGNKQHGAGRITGIAKDEQSLSDQIIRIKYNFTIQHMP